eukprot:Partr_v1_DN28083_c1_g1_i2_m56856 putative L2hydroxyglutarate dehydrogenase
MKRKTAVIIGAGVVGLAIGARLSKRFQVHILDRHPYAANEASSRNSEVIHAGLYYPPTSLKMKHCVRGRKMIYQLAADTDIPHRRCGKLIVATGSGGAAERLDAIRRRALEVDVPVEIASRKLVEAKAPWLRVENEGVLWSEASGIVDSHALVQRLEAQLLAGGDAHLLLRHRVSSIERRVGGGYRVGGECEVRQGKSELFQVDADVVVNSAGLHADHVSRMLLPGCVSIPRVYPCRGHYYTLRVPAATHPLDTLVYPLPEAGLKGLGVHLTIDLSGRIRVGPDAEYLDADLDSSRENYRLDDTRERRDRFFASVQRYMRLDDRYRDKMVADYVGIRAKLSGPGDLEFRDFCIEQPLDGFVHCLGIESPGLTACLSIAQDVDDMLQ